MSRKSERAAKKAAKKTESAPVKEDEEVPQAVALEIENMSVDDVAEEVDEEEVEEEELGEEEIGEEEISEEEIEQTQQQSRAVRDRINDENYRTVQVEGLALD
ncbi:hypothetical protein G6F56_010790 [Rhizopus delemar]|nr:hypothetical protein G6F56_010790 [Rhizopus delemar]